MLNPAEALQAAMAHHQAGRLREAEALYRQIVAIDARNAQAFFLLGAALLAQGQYQPAIASFDRVLALAPGAALAHFNRATALHALEDLDAAATAYRETLRLVPDHVAAMVNLGDLLRSQGCWDESLAWCRRAVGLKPDLAEAHNNLGAVLVQQRQFGAAADCYRRAVQLRPDFADAHTNLGEVFQAMDLHGEAAASFRRACQLKPDDAAAHHRLGVVLEKQDEPLSAEACFRQAVAIDPQRAATHSLLGNVLQQQARFGEALEEYERALALDPQNGDYHFYRATIWLLQGDFVRGWPELEWRLKSQFARPPYPQPRWQGQELHGQRIVIHSEWGLGDTLNFIRYAPQVAARGGDVVLEMQANLIPLLTDAGFKQLYPARGDKTPPCQWHVPIFSLPGIFGEGIEPPVAAVPYLQAREELVAAWGQRLREFAGLRVGIHWHSDRRAPAAAPRSIPLAEFAPLSHIGGVTLISLQKKERGAPLPGHDGRVSVVDLGDELDTAGSFLDTVAIMKNLDLVITCDTSVAHVAGALGVPVWMVLARACEFRWLLDRTDTPWYPTMRLFRQPRAGDWTGAMAQIEFELAHLAREHHT